MAGQSNDQLQFAAVGGFDRHRSQYRDTYGNQWRIDAIGTPDVVAQFIKQRALFIEARPLSQDEADKLQAQIEERAKGYKPGPPIERVRQEMPALIVNVTLEFLADEKSPYAVSFLVDPPMNPQHIPEEYGFSLQGSESVAAVNYKSNGGVIQLELKGAGRAVTSTAGQSGGVSSEGVYPGSEWTVTVLWVSDSPDYTFTGDIAARLERQS